MKDDQKQSTRQAFKAALKRRQQATLRKRPSRQTRTAARHGASRPSGTVLPAPLRLLTQPVMAHCEKLRTYAGQLPRTHTTSAALLAAALVIIAVLPEQQSDTLAAARSQSLMPQVALVAREMRHNQNSAGLLSESSSDQHDIAQPALSPTAPRRVASNRDAQAPVMLEVKSGDNLSLIFNRAGLSAQDVALIARSDAHTDVLTRLYPGYQLAFHIDEDSQRLTQLTIQTSPLESYVYERSDEGFSAHKIDRQPEIRPAFKEASIEDSLFMAAQRGGISAGLTMQLADIFGGVIDFLQDTRAGDTFNILYEEKYLDGEYIGNGAILAAQFINQGQPHTAVRYTNPSGETNYYSPQGESMRKAFLRNPVDFVRISSNFNPNRRHPIHNTIRAHKGTDYAAPTGTPVVAAGDGRVTWAARNGSFGNLVVIKHNDRFETKYAHLNGYAKGIKNGARVRQGQVIGYVGATGGATGPHLHYEFLMDGVHRNPRTIHNELPKAESIAATELPSFRQQTQVILAQLGGYTRNPSLAQHTYQENP